jgi:DNA helicase-2/ATP-dependent DNA helicase PcrA
MALGSRDGLEEERRLFYVALTRPRRALHLYHPVRYHYRPRGRDDAHGYGQPSRFVSPAVGACFDHVSVGHDDPAIELAAFDATVVVDLELDALWS